MVKHDLNIFPEMNTEDYQRLVVDLQTNGYDESQPIYTYENKILDGWNRYRACSTIGIKPVVKEFTGTDIDAIQFVMRTNKRRNLSSSQWAAIAVEAVGIIDTISKEVEVERLAKQKANAANRYTNDLASVNKFTQATPERTTAKTAELFNTNHVYIHEAQHLKDTKPEVFEQVKRGEKTITEAKREEKKEEQQKRFKSLKEKENQPHDTNQKYDVIVIDPPWEMEKINREVAPLQVGFDYPTMTIEQIKQIQLPAEDKCHVFMWITQKHLPFGFDIFKSWGVKYVCSFVWHKNGGFQPFGLPQYNCEFILYGRIGTPEFYDLKDFNLCFNANRTGHSAKPDEFYQMINRVTAGNKLDMFNRRPIDGFKTWGNESK